MAAGSYTNWLYLLSFNESDGNYLTSNDNQAIASTVDPDTGVSQDSDGLLEATDGTGILSIDSNFEYTGWTLHGYPVLYSSLSGYYVPNNGGIPAFESGTATEATEFTLCFLTGTQIQTTEGLKAVELLTTGDLVITADGTSQPVRFVFNRAYRHPFIIKHEAYPICITKYALGNNMPENDLYISLDHAIMVDGVFTQANALVNGISIYQVETMPEEFTYYHIELENHELILAEGVESETYIDNVSREAFDNYDEYVALYGEPDEEMNELDMPRAKSVRQLPRKLKEKLHQRAVELFPDKTKDVA